MKLSQQTKKYAFAQVQHENGENFLNCPASREMPVKFRRRLIKFT